MKTLAVLSALATIAIAAPAHDGNKDSTYFTLADHTIPKLREKKSMLPDTEKEISPQHFGDRHALEQLSNKFEPSDSVARTFSSFKKPIIVKKKIGYQLYRDSDEEQSQADPRENCREHIKVKLCDDNNSLDKMKGASNDKTHEELTEREMKHSIDMAKAAVEIFQKDLEKMEQDSTKERHLAVGSHTELREDIEKARLALEHIQRKFNDLESDTDIEDTSNTNLKMMRMDENKIAQWKEAGNHHKNVEISKNLEDNFKFANENKDLKTIASTQFKTETMDEEDKDKTMTHTTIEDLDKRTSSDMKNTIIEGMTSIIEDKSPKMDIRSESLVKEPTNEQKEQTQTMEQNLRESNKIMEKKLDDVFTHIERTDTKNSAEHKDMENIKSQHITDEQNKERVHGDSDKDEKNVDNHLGKTGQPIEDTSNHHLRSKIENELQKEHLRSIHENDQAIHESKHMDTINTNNNEKTLRAEDAEMLHKEVNLDHGHENNHHHHENIQQKSTLTTELKSVNTDHLMADDQKTQDEKLHIRSRMDHEHIEKKNDHLMPTHTRASSNFHKELLNNMDFVEDPLHKPQMEENHEMHERFNVPEVQANSEHLRTMMQFSDNHRTIQTPQSKMSSMFNNEQPNFNVQFNSPQDFEEQTNIQGIPFRTAGDLHEKHFHKMDLEERFNNMHEMDDIPTDLHDPLKTRWAQTNEMNTDKLRATSELNQGNMQMDGSSHHFHVDNVPLRTASINAHNMDPEHLRAYQRWAQAQHNHDHFISRNNDHMMHESTHNAMRGSPKMALEYASPNQWTHNHGAFRSSYGPAMSASYGSGGGSASGGGTVVGVFPNSNAGNCAVPLLLSCSPSVVSGNLAKANSASYNTPSYRSEDMNFHKKRGINTNEANTGLKLQRLVPHVHKSNTISERKL